MDVVRDLILQQNANTKPLFLKNCLIDGFYHTNHFDIKLTKNKQTEKNTGHRGPITNVEDSTGIPSRSQTIANKLQWAEPVGIQVGKYDSALSK